MEYILKMPIERSLKLIETAQEEETREYYYRWWLVRYPLYDSKNYEPFSEFYDKAKPKNIVYDNRSKEEIMQEILEIESSKKGDEDNRTI